MANNFDRRQRLPQGVYDMMVSETALRRKIEGELLATFRGWGYGEVTPPTFSYLESFPEELGAIEREKMLKFLDRRGEILALRPELTSTVARLAATKYKDHPKPIRLCYLANAFHYETPNAGRKSEFWQAGVELIGDTGAQGDAEVIALAIESLERLGLDSFKMDLGQVNFIHGLLDETELDEDARDQVRSAINRGDYVWLRQHGSLMAAGSLSQGGLGDLSSLRGGEEVIDRASRLTRNPQALEALDNLSRVYDNLKTFGLEDKIHLDLSLVRELAYYTGIVFEGYGGGIGYPLCGGGRYDKLLDYYGCDCGATGFALSLDLLMNSNLEIGDELKIDPDYVITYREEDKASAYRKAKKLRDSGAAVVLELIK